MHNMLEDTSLRFSSRKIFELVMSNTDLVEPEHSYRLQWLARWTQTTNASSLQSHKESAGPNSVKDRRGHCNLPGEAIKPGYPCECNNGWRDDLGKQDPTSYMLKSKEVQRGEHGFKITKNSVLMKNASKSVSETLEKLPEQKLPASVMNWENISSYHSQNSTSSTSEWTNFPMFDINKKLETIMAPIKQTICKDNAAKMNQHLLPLAPHLIEFASEGHQHQQQNTSKTDKQVWQYESVEGLPQCNCLCSNMISSMQNDEEDDIFCSGLAFKEHFANANIHCSKHELFSSAKYTTGMVSEMKNGTVGCSKSSQIMDGSSYSNGGDVPHPSLPADCSEEIENVCVRNRITPQLTRSKKMTNCSNIGRTKEEFQRFSNSSKYLLITKEVMGIPHIDQIGGVSTVSPSAWQEKIWQNLMSLRNNKEVVEGVNTQHMKKKQESSVKTDTKHKAVTGTMGSHEVRSSFKSPKILQDVEVPNLKSSEKEVTDTSRIQNIDELSRKPFNPPSEITERVSAPSWKWVKRLRPNPLDHIPFVTKRFKMGETSSKSEMQNLLARAASCNKSISDIPGCQQLGKTTSFPNGDECSSEESAKVIPWIRRWCRNNQDSASTTLVLCEPESSKVPPEKLEAKQFPSLAAMALMGKQVTNFRPCELQKRGATTIWKL